MGKNPERIYFLASYGYIRASFSINNKLRIKEIYIISYSRGF